ncbi:hypothetical protein ACWDR0_18450 [Streptomyces sp. NPDC003691]
MHQRPEASENRSESRAAPGGPGGTEEPSGDRQRPERRLDLSLPQVAGSVLATVAAAVLASRLGVYGTIIGAGVVSAVATCGGPLIQHLFSRTGDQLRGVRAPVRSPGRGNGPGKRRDPAPARPSGEFGAATTHGTRMRGWKRPAAAAAVVFGVAMAGITGYELVSGSGLDGGPGTTVGSVVRGGSSDTAPPPGDPSPPRQDGDGGNDGRTERTPPPGEGSGESAPPDRDPSSGPSGTPDPAESGPASPPPSPPGEGGTPSGPATGTGGSGADAGSRTGTDPGSGTAPGRTGG